MAQWIRLQTLTQKIPGSNPNHINCSTVQCTSFSLPIPLNWSLRYWLTWWME